MSTYHYDSVAAARAAVVTAINESTLPVRAYGHTPNHIAPGVAVVQFDGSVQVRGAHEVMFEVRIFLHQVPAQAVQWIDDNVDNVLRTMSGVLHSIELLPQASQMSGQSKATGAELTVLSVFGKSYVEV